MTRAELLAALERERICGDPKALMTERYAPTVKERVAGHPDEDPGLSLPPVTAEMADRNRHRLAAAIGEYDAYDPYEEARCAS